MSAALRAAFAAAAQGAHQAPTPPLFTMRAGMMNSDSGVGGRVRLAADKRKGELLVARDGEGMVHVQWRDRATGALAFDRVVFPGDVTFKRIASPGGAKDCIVELRYVAGAQQRFFFWLQEPKADGNALRVTEFLSAIDNPPPAGGAAGDDDVGGAAPGAPRRRLARSGAGAGAAGAIDAAALAQMLAAMGVPAAASPGSPPAPQPVAPVAAAAAPPLAPPSAMAVEPPPPLQPLSPSAGADEDAELQAALMLSMQEESGNAPGQAEGGGVAPGGSSDAAANSAAKPDEPPPGAGGTGAQDLQRVLAALVASGLVSAHPASRRRGTTMLVHVLEPEALIAAVRSDERLLAALSEHLPLGATVEGASTLARVEEVLRSAQLRSAMGALSAALEGAENEAAILASFGLRPSDGDAALAATGDHLAALVAALNAAVARRRATNAAAGGSAPPGPLPPPGGHDEGAQ